MIGFEAPSAEAATSRQELEVHLQLLQVWLNHVESEAGTIATHAADHPEFLDDLAALRLCLESARREVEMFNQHLRGPAQMPLFPRPSV
jgi:hypothetical protein